MCVCVCVCVYVSMQACLCMCVLPRYVLHYILFSSNAKVFTNTSFMYLLMILHIIAKHKTKRQVDTFKRC